MEFFTQIEFPEPPFRLEHSDTLLMLGSCFAENMGARLAENKFDIDINPFGTLYNPASIGCALWMLLAGKRLVEEDLFEHGGAFHSFMHHSRFSSATAEEALAMMNGRMERAAARLARLDCLVATWGTAWVYRLRESGEVVANCHKLPERRFVRGRLAVDEIVRDWSDLLAALWEARPALKVLLTVSPVRHWKDGAHGNQLSKATLLLAIDELRRRFPGKVDYFPSYEILMDELRDYRFYADDMLHPSPQAVEYIWDKFKEYYLSARAKAVMREWAEIQRAINHKPFQPQSEAYRKFMFQTLLKMKRIQEKFPYFDLAEEFEWIQSKLEE